MGTPVVGTGPKKVEFVDRWTPGCARKPEQVYVASSWRNPRQADVVKAIRAAGIETYDFKDEDGFHWTEVGGSNWRETNAEYFIAMLQHPRAKQGFNRDFTAMQGSEACVLVQPCGRSAHLEAGWFTGMAIPTAILLDDECEPELMYSMVDHLTTTIYGVLQWLGAK